MDPGAINQVIGSVFLGPVGIRVLKDFLIAIGRRPIQIDSLAGLEYESRDVLRAAGLALLAFVAIKRSTITTWTFFAILAGTELGVDADSSANSLDASTPVTDEKLQLRGNRQQSTARLRVWERIEIVSIAEVHTSEVLFHAEVQRAVETEIDGSINSNLTISGPSDCLNVGHSYDNFVGRESDLRRLHGGVAHQSVGKTHLVFWREVNDLLNTACVDQL
jgi:hypothetical protein